MAKGSVRGYSVFSIDPGETTGWAWSCLGSNELKSLGVARALKKASTHRSGLLAADSRLEIGQVSHPVDVSDYWEAERLQCEEMMIQMLRMDSLTRRVSGGAVRGLTQIVIEDFILRNASKDRSLLSPVRVTTFLREMLSVELPKVEITLQPPSAKAVITDNRLKDAGLWTAGVPHAMDGLRHLSIYYRSIR